MKQSKSSREWSFRIKDILNAIGKIEKYTDGMTISEFKKNELVIDGVIRNFEVIGEASNGIPLTVQLEHPRIPWKQMVALRNFLIHEYFGIDVNTLWETAHTHLPALKSQLLELI